MEVVKLLKNYATVIQSQFRGVIGHLTLEGTYGSL